MIGRDKQRRTGWSWRRIGLTTLSGVGLASAGWWWFQAGELPRAEARQPAPLPAAATQNAQPLKPAPTPSASEYNSRVVAYINDTIPISREELGEYLIARQGVAKIDLLVNKRIIEIECGKRGIEVTGSEIEAAFEEKLRGLNIDRQGFIDRVLRSYHKNLVEWKEDVLRPQLLMTKLLRDRVVVTEEEIHKAFEALYGEKIDCRVIVWEPGEQDLALAQYAEIRNSEEAFARIARAQRRPELAASGGKIRPIARHAGDKVLEDAAYGLQPGQVSQIISTEEAGKKQLVVVKCDRRIPQDSSVNWETVRPKIVQDLTASKVKLHFEGAVKEMRERAKPQPVPNALAENGGPGQVIARIFDNIPVTREELGEFLIARYGAEKVDLLVNQRIIDMECKQRGVEVTEAEIDAAFEQDLAQLKVDKNTFLKDVLKAHRMTLREYREDLLRPRLAMAKLVRDRVTVEPEDLEKAKAAFYGEKVDCRMILWERGQEKFALAEYAKIRDSEAEFAYKAKHQGSSLLASRGGKMEPIGRWTTGNEELEKAAFALDVGEVSQVIGTPEGAVVLKCDRKLPAEPVKMEDVRPRLEREVVDRKTKAMVPVVFAEMRAKAKPKYLLPGVKVPEDLAQQVKPLLEEGKPRSE